MYKRIFALIVIFAMLVPFSPAVAADDSSAKPTVEEILNEYHQTAFAAKNADRSGAVSAASRNSASKTLEQETVDNLNAAGYEAYNVTPSNYDALEKSLQTDFGDLVLDPAGSYIVVISGEDAEENISNSKTRGSPDFSYEDDLEGASSFTHTYNGVTYHMRYVTVTSAQRSYMRVDSTYNLQPSMWAAEAGMDIFNTVLAAGADSLTSRVPIGTIFSLMTDWMIDDNYTELEPDTITIHAGTIWTCSTIQVWNTRFERWDTTQASAYAVSSAKCAGFLYNAETNSLEWKEGIIKSNTQHSPKYYNDTQRKTDAAQAFVSGNASYDRTGDIDFYLEDENGNIVYEANGYPLFTHQEGWNVSYFN